MGKKLRYVGSLLINSADRVASTTIQNAQYNLPSLYSGVDYFCIDSANIQPMQYDINAGETFQFVFNATDYAYTFTSITQGNYTAAGLAAFLQARILALTSTASLTVVFDSINNCFTFNSNNASTLLIKRCPIFRMIGAIIDNSDVTTLTYPDTEQTTFKMPYPVNFPKTQSFDFCSRILTQYDNTSISTSGKISNTLLRVSNNLSFGNVVSYDNKYKKHFIYDRTQTIDKIDIQIYNDDGSTPILNNTVYNMSISFYRNQ